MSIATGLTRGRAGSLAVAAVLLAGGLLAPGASAATQPVTARAAAPAELRVSEGGGSVFPARSLVLSVPGRASLSASELHLSENGAPVPTAVITQAANARADDFGIVLAIDTSPSMQGRPLENAMIAARALARQRVGLQQLGLIEFDRTPTVVLPLTGDDQAIATALRGRPAVGGGTHIYDALALALQQLHSAHIAAGAVILLSDGADRGSTTSEQAVAAAARAAHISLYTVGVRDQAFDASSLSMLARDGGGQFLATDSSGLEQLVTGLASRFAGQYVVRYRSQQAPGAHVQVRVSVTGVPGTTALSYLAPAPPRALTVKPPSPQAGSFWTSTVALVALSAAVGLLIALAIVACLAPGVRRKTLRARVGELTATGLPAPDKRAAPAGSTPATLERMLERTRWWAGFTEQVEIARFERSAVQLVALCAAGTLAAVMLVGPILGVAPLAIAALVLGPLSLRAIVARRLRRERALFAEQLPDHLQELASAMRAGHSLVSGISTMAQAAIEPSRGEWGRVLADEQLGMPLEDAMRTLARRMDCPDIEQVAMVAALHQRSGGNMAEVIEHVAEGARGRADLRRELQSLTAQARLSRGIVTALPPALLAMISLINPGYMRPLVQTGGGQIMFALAIALVIAGWFVMRKMTDIKV